MQKSNINRLIETFRDTFYKLDKDVSLSQLEDLSCLIHNAMEGGRRNFHTCKHIFEVCEEMKPLPVLAALFHDIVYFQVDDGFPQQLEDLLLKFVAVENDEVMILNVFGENPIFQACLTIFDFHSGETLSPFAGMNEFLSAIVAVEKLQEHLAVHQLLTIIACVEATIPFRASDETGNPFDKLQKKLQKAAISCHIDITAEEIDEMVQQAVELANKDVENFADSDPGRFLDNTWVLLPETNAILWSVGLYSIQNYRQALMKMEGFLNFLNPQNIFHSYKNTPDPTQFEKMLKQAEANVYIAKEYLGIKLLAMAIIEALAISTGGDVPIAMFMGDVRRDNEPIQRAEDYLPDITPRGHLKYDIILLSLLKYGRANESSFDMKSSPLAAFIYQKLGHQQMHEYLEVAREMFQEKISPQQFLDKIDSSIVIAIASACSYIALSRSEALQEIIAAVS